MQGHGVFCGRVHAINTRRAKPASKSLKRPHGTRHTLAISHAALSPDFNLPDRLAQILIVDNRDIPELQPPCLVGPQSGIDREEHKVVQLFRFPVESPVLGFMRALPCCFVEFLVFLWREPSPWEILGDDRYGSEKSGSRSSQPWRSAVFKVCEASQFPDEGCYGQVACRT